MKGRTLKLSQYVDTLQSEGQYWFLRPRAIEALGVSSDAFKLAANRLSKKGRVKRIHGEFFVIVPLEYQSAGCLPAPWFIDDLMQHYESEYYVCLLSAAAIHGAAHQQPMTFQVMTNQILRAKTVGNLQLKYHFKKVIKSSFSQSIKTPTGYMQISTPDMTACDLIRHMESAGQIHNVATIISELADQINISNIISFVQDDDIEIATIQRLGFLMEELKVSFDPVPLLSIIKENQPNYRLLVSGTDTEVTERNKRWRILVNETVESDL